MAILHRTTVTQIGDAAIFTASGFLVTGADPVLVVKVAIKGSATVDSVSWNVAEAFTQLNTDINGDARVEMWYLPNPTATIANIVVTISSSSRCVVGYSQYTGVDDTTPFRLAANSSGNGTDDNPTTIVVALNNEMVVDSLCQVSDGPDIGVAGHTERHNTAATGAGTDTRGASQEKASSGAMEVMFWAMSGADNWAICAGALQEPFNEDVYTTTSPNKVEFKQVQRTATAGSGTEVLTGLLGAPITVHAIMLDDALPVGSSAGWSDGTNNWNRWSDTAGIVIGAEEKLGHVKHSASTDGYQLTAGSFTANSLTLTWTKLGNGRAVTVNLLIYYR